jgi:UDP:flavonoid glycosyltransferase YjiC (YdhE family)
VRYLFVTVDGGGNLYPALALAARLAARGHEVRFLGNRSQRGPIERAGFGFAPFRLAPDIDATASDDNRIKDWAQDQAAVFAALCDHVWFGPAARFAADVTAEIERDRADALAVDYFLFGALAGAERAGVPAAALWHTTFGEFDALNQGLPALNAARSTIGLPPLRTVFGQYRRAARVLVLTHESFDFAIKPVELPDNVRHVGPQVLPGSGAWPAGDERRPLVLVGLSTTYQAQEDLLRRVIAALGSLPVRRLVTTGPAVGVPPDLPGNVEVSAWIPHADVLPHAALVITHAGMGTVTAAMVHGVPMVCLPMGRDQDGNAARVEHLGLGRVLRPDRDRAGDVRRAGPPLAGQLRACETAPGHAGVAGPAWLAGGRELAPRRVGRRPAACSLTAANCPRRRLAAAALAARRAEQVRSGEEQGHERGAGRAQCQQSRHRVITGDEGRYEQQPREQGRRDDRALTRLPVSACRRIVPYRSRPQRSRRRGQPGRDVGGDHGQIGVGARGERLADPRVELVLGHQAVHISGLERADHALAVGVGCSQAAMPAPRCHLVLWPGHRGCLPRS